ncbi:hypothetical protein KZ848_26685, partial [Pseudomonas aeruginosa]|nr:hypothetical protein [Pseudomonas aeruginosa]
MLWPLPLLAMAISPRDGGHSTQSLSRPWLLLQSRSASRVRSRLSVPVSVCLLNPSYPSPEPTSVEPGGRRTIKKKKINKKDDNTTQKKKT